jgi:hypothetical protein
MWTMRWQSLQQGKLAFRLASTDHFVIAEIRCRSEEQKG